MDSLTRPFILEKDDQALKFQIPESKVTDATLDKYELVGKLLGKFVVMDLPVWKSPKARQYASYGLIIGVFLSTILTEDEITEDQMVA